MLLSNGMVRYLQCKHWNCTIVHYLKVQCQKRTLYSGKTKRAVYFICLRSRKKKKLRMLLTFQIMLVVLSVMYTVDLPPSDTVFLSLFINHLFIRVTADVPAKRVDEARHPIPHPHTCTSTALKLHVSISFFFSDSQNIYMHCVYQFNFNILWLHRYLLYEQLIGI